MKTQILPPPIARLLIAILMCLPICGSRLSAQEPYAVYDKTTSTLTFKYGTKPAGAYSLNKGYHTPDWYKQGGDYDSGYYNTNIITKVVFDVSFAKARPTSCFYWFRGCKYLTTIEGIENLNTTNVTDMGWMFNGCSALKTLDLSYFDTKNVTNMFEMFSYCYDLTTLNLPRFNTQNVESMVDMFKSCVSLTTLDLSSFNTQNVTKMENMFKNCRALTTLDLSSFNTQNVTTMEGMFRGCVSLTTLDLSSFNTKNVTDMGLMFENCKSLTTLDLSSFNTQNVTSMGDMFEDCSALTTLDVSNFDTQNVRSMDYMFENCSALTTLDLSSFNTQNVMYMDRMFKNCSALTTIYASEKYVTTACEFGRYMFAGCTNLVGAVPYNENKVGKEMANYFTGYFTDKAATGIDAPTVSDDTAAEYYDLQGRRLNAPQKGVNIVKRGKKTTKVLVK
ncbi:BspA family leucine-rich repeat surface protein [Leyella stercorea]|uniref:BspA family leucine-rich repeat surface protein n=1 Tax=Leyella stercorea TaxID=363265 RepID=UPI0034E9636E